MAGLSATYIDADTFTVAGDLTTTFIVGRRVKADCGVDGYKFGTIDSVSFGGGVTTVNLTAASDDLTSNLTQVWYGIVGGGAFDQSMPIHTHDGDEGSGGSLERDCCVGVSYEGVDEPGSPFDTINFVGDNIAIDSTADTVDVQVIFGQEYSYNSVDGESTTTSGTPQQKVRLTTGDLPLGTYHIEWGYEYSITDNKDSEFNSQVQINDTTTIAENEGGIERAGNWAPDSGFYDAVLSGVLNIDIDYWESDTDGVSMRRARLAIWRVE